MEHLSAPISQLGSTVSSASPPQTSIPESNGNAQQPRFAMIPDAPSQNHISGIHFDGQDPGTEPSIHQVSELVREIFRPLESDHSGSNASYSFSPDDLSTGYPDLYAHTFSATQPLIQVLSTVDASRSTWGMAKETTILSSWGDSELLLIVSCFLRLLTTYDKIFIFWHNLLESSTKNGLTLGTLDNCMPYLLPPVSIGMFLEPRCSLAQLRLVVETCSNMYDDLGRSLQHISNSVTGRDRIAAADRTTYLSDAVFELVVSREWLTRSKRDKMLDLIEDNAVQRKIEELISSFGMPSNHPGQNFLGIDIPISVWLRNTEDMLKIVLDLDFQALVAADDEVSEGDRGTVSAGWEEVYVDGKIDNVEDGKRLYPPCSEYINVGDGSKPSTRPADISF
ncbi:hypothetical protein BDV95DRAFT_608555 [Massariosphaeria phaeospora]|uniref:Uncharacterized protein n=1 Tax=Massariosphaeria phaeospora TaxID=100035 RepID=A0A7C8I387_9PLEO|nr:hypothetical protein BDV95DRAFT_608555 [Massariosphaeria phaeospora]